MFSCLSFVFSFFTRLYADFCTTKTNKTNQNYGRSDTESHTDVNKSEGKRNKYVIQLNNLFKKHTGKAEAPAPNDAEEGKVSNDEEDNAPPSESTVIVEDEPQKKVWIFERKISLKISFI